MKLFQILLLNVATVVVALVVYDQLQNNDSGSTSERASSSRSNVRESVGLEQRLQKIEAKLAALPKSDDWRKAAIAEPAVPGRAAEDKELPPPVRVLGDAPHERGASPTPTSDSPTEAEVARFRRLQAAVARENTIKKNWDRVEHQLSKAAVNLTPKQRHQVHEAFADFQPRIVRIWGEIKTQARATIDAGGEIDRHALGERGYERVQSEFAATLDGIVNHQADAEAVAAALTGPGGK